MDSPLLDNVLLAGLVGCLIALIVATAQQNWRPRVFFLLALRIAIGWQFLFEGLNKIQSHRVGAVETGKPFSSEPYFRESEGPIADLMRTRMDLADPEIRLYELARPAANPATVGDVLGADGMAALQADIAKPGAAFNIARMYTPDPPAGVADPAGFYAQAIGKLPLTGTGAKFLGEYPATAAGYPTIRDKVTAQLPPAAARQFDTWEAQLPPLAKGDKERTAVQNLFPALRGKYARWATGVEADIVKKKYVSGEVALGVPARLAEYEEREKTLADLRSHRASDLGRSTLFARIQTAKADVAALRNELVKEGDTLLADAKTELEKLAEAKLPADAPAPARKIVTIDVLTMWVLAVAGGCLIIGLGTRLAAVVCGGFLVLTYLTYPPFPWLPHPPGTEGNPVFVNKNIIEALACFALAAMPTGRWLGIDALIYRLVRGPQSTPAA